MRRIAREKNSPKSELVNLAMGDMEARQPNRVAQSHAPAGSLIYKRLHLSQLWFAPFRISFPISNRSNYAVAFRSKRKNSYDTIIRQE
jgi:hypothetical protein